MSGYRWIMTIVKRDERDVYARYLKSRGIETQYATLVNGTASKTMLDYLGIERTEKVMIEAMCEAAEAERILRGYETHLGIDLPGNGIALTVPVATVGGVSSLTELTRGQQINMDEGKHMSENHYALIVTIADKGSVDTVMDAARSAGARGGTVIGARGTGKPEHARFFGMSIGEEKEIVYIVTKKADKAAIMQAIMDKAGPHTDAHGVLFSLPVDSIVGLQSVAEEAPIG